MNNVFYIKKYFIWMGSEEEQSPKVDFIPSLTRRRLTNIEKIGLYLARQVEPISAETKIVFASRYGEWQQTIKLIQQMYNDNEMSPAGFSHSVHNAMPGILSIVTKTPYNYTTIAAQDETIDCALIESLSTREDVLFIYAEESTPTFYAQEFDKPFSGHGLAFVMTRESSAQARKVTITKNLEPSNESTYFSDLAQFLEGKSKTLTSKFYTFKEE